MHPYNSAFHASPQGLGAQAAENAQNVALYKYPLAVKFQVSQHAGESVSSRKLITAGPKETLANCFLASRGFHSKTTHFQENKQTNK